MDSKWLEIAKEWVNLDPNEETKNEIMMDIANNNLVALEKKLNCRLEFGTAGLRGPMGAGSCFMNDLVIIQTSQGLCSYLENCFGEQLKTMGVAIGFDHRAKGSLNSKQFAELLGAVCLSRGIPIYLYRGTVATPFVPWCVDQMHCAAGVMITASHNPKQDNGYKVYWSNGAQIISPHDKGIATEIEKNLKPWHIYNVETVRSSPLCHDLTDMLTTKYFKTLSSTLCRYPKANQESSLRIAYTAMHGVGHEWTSKSFAAFGLPPYVPVTKQIYPDPEFPTVAFPNPEEGQGALELAFQVANETNCSIVLANDPDADRLAVAEKQSNGEWTIFTGNEIALLLGYWEWQCFVEKNPTCVKDDVYMIASTVSSKALRAVAKAEGFHFEETLTGFKWMGNRTDQLRQEGKTVLFSFEEAIGFCVGDVVKDKDGVCAAAVFAEMANQLYLNGKTIYGQLRYLYATYGEFVSQNYYVKCYEPSTIVKIFERLRNGGKYWDRCGPYEIASIRDLTTGYDNNQPDNKAVLPTSKSTQMITYTFSNGCIATLRTSGTEPKLKYYVELQGKVGEPRELTKTTVAKMVETIVQEMLQPELNQLEV